MCGCLSWRQKRRDREVVTRLIAVLIGCLLALTVAGAVFAKSTISVEIVVDVPNAGLSTFTAGALCTSGTAENFFENFGGAGPSRAGTFHGYKTLTCTVGGSGTFNITYDAAVVFGAPQDQGGWRLYGGTGDFAGCTGGGNLVGYYYDGGIEDHYTGNVSCP
jgi:hypothetical protein